MNHLETLAVNSDIAVYVMASPDTQDIEILPLKPYTASEAERENLAARWPGRGLQGIEVIGRLADGTTHVALRVPFPFSQLQLAALLLAFTNHCEGRNATEPQCDDSVTWLERLHALPDSRGFMA